MKAAYLGFFLSCLMISCISPIVVSSSSTRNETSLGVDPLKYMDQCQQASTGIFFFGDQWKIFIRAAIAFMSYKSFSFQYPDNRGNGRMR
jgi:hypothetical protein